MRRILLILAALFLLEGCVVDLSDRNKPKVEITHRVASNAIHVKATITASSSQSLAMVIHPDFYLLDIRPSNMKLSKAISGGNASLMPSSWQNVKFLSLKSPIIFEAAVPYRHLPTGQLLVGDYEGAYHPGSYLTMDKKLKAQFRYHIQYAHMPRLWWLSGHQFLSNELAAETTFDAP